MKSILPFAKLAGRFQISVCTPQKLPPLLNRWTKNSVQFGAADVLGRLLSGDIRVVPAGMYMEFTNNLGAWVRPTNFGREGYTYFHSILAGTDVIRVPLLQTPGYDASSDIYASNQTTFIAQSGGADGVAGKNAVLTFDRAVSYVVGGGLIAMPDPDDWSQDLVLTRGYVASADAILRPASPNEVMMRWQFVIS